MGTKSLEPAIPLRKPAPFFQFRTPSCKSSTPTFPPIGLQKKGGPSVLRPMTMIMTLTRVTRVTSVMVMMVLMRKNRWIRHAKRVGGSKIIRFVEKLHPTIGPQTLRMSYLRGLWVGLLSKPVHLTHVLAPWYQRLCLMDRSPHRVWMKGRPNSDSNS